MSFVDEVRKTEEKTLNYYAEEIQFLNNRVKAYRFNKISKNFRAGNELEK